MHLADLRKLTSLDPKSILKSYNNIKKLKTDQQLSTFNTLLTHCNISSNNNNSTTTAPTTTTTTTTANATSRSSNTNTNTTSVLNSPITRVPSTTIQDQVHRYNTSSSSSSNKNKANHHDEATSEDIGVQDT